MESVADAQGASALAFEAAAVESAGVAEAIVAPVDVDAEAAPSTLFVRPDVNRLAERAKRWSAARVRAIDEGLLEPNIVNPPSGTNLSLLPAVTAPGDVAPPEPEPIPEPEPAEPVEPDPEDPIVVEPGPVEPDPVEPDPDPQEPADPDPIAPEPDPEEAADPDDPVPNPPAAVNGRVPPPAGGPTAAQWDALRRCESTHNYLAVSSTGLYRGAYQFSQQTWDWVAAIHYPYLVGIDPIDAAPGWQDVMAYTLYAMRGWDQWPICGRNLI